MNTDLTLDLSALSKRRVIIDGDENRVLMLNVSDMNVIVRLKDKYQELADLEEEALNNLSKKSKGDIKEDIENAANTLDDINQKMRSIMDYIFDADVSDKCAPFGNMFDFINGKARYEHIFDALVQLYDDNIKSETKKVEKRINENKHTQKYVKKK